MHLKNSPERIARNYGIEAAKGNRPRNPDADKEFNMWSAEYAKKTELEGDDFMEFWDHMINCWEDGYDDCKRGDIV